MIAKLSQIGHYVDGKPVAGASGRTAPVYNPALGVATTEVALASAAVFVVLYVPFGPVRLGYPPLPCGFTEDGVEVCQPIMLMPRPESLLGLSGDWVLVPLVGAVMTAVVVGLWGGRHRVES